VAGASLIYELSPPESRPKTQLFNLVCLGLGIISSFLISLGEDGSKYRWRINTLIPGFLGLIHL
jgi:hypothetical protein